MKKKVLKKLAVSTPPPIDEMKAAVMREQLASQLFDISHKLRCGRIRDALLYQESCRLEREYLKFFDSLPSPLPVCKDAKCVCQKLDQVDRMIWPQMGLEETEIVRFRKFQRDTTGALPPEEFKKYLVDAE